VIAGVADTHAALWYLLKNPRLSVAARTFFHAVAEAGDSILLSAISLAELVYLIEKSWLPTSAYEDLKLALKDPDYVIDEAPFEGNIVEAMRKVSRDDVPDMPDRIVAATGLYFGLPVISRDGKIRTSAVKAIW
jgi:PIN domain nuclease of toxin-antitoxin system